MKFTVTATFRASVDVELPSDITGYPHNKLLREVMREAKDKACSQIQVDLAAYHVIIVTPESVNILESEA